MSLQRTPVSGAIVKQLLRFGYASMAALTAGDYAVPPNIAPGSTGIQAVGSNGLSWAAYAIKMQFPGAIVKLTVKNRVATGLVTDVVNYKVFKIPATADFGTVVPTQLAAGRLEVSVANTDTAVKEAAIAINNAVDGAYAADDYIFVQATIPAPGPLSASPGAADIELEFFDSK